MRTELLNLYMSHLPVKSERTPVHNAVIRTGQYDHTDIFFTSQPEGYRHWIVARPGAPTGDFQMNYSGQTDLSISSTGELVIETALGDITQKTPKAYTMDPATGVLTELSWQPEYVLVDVSTVGFTYSGSWSGTLVIELDQKSQLGTETATIGNLDWSTFVGGTGREIFYGSDATPDENVWVAGEISYELFAEFTDEANFEGDFLGQSEMVVARFDELCRLVFVTVYGGEQDDLAYDISVNDMGEGLVVGWTQSQSIDFVGSPSSINETGYGGGIADGLVIFVREDGVVLVDSYFGGTGTDIVTAVDHFYDDELQENVFWLVGYSSSGVGFPSTTGGGFYLPHQGGMDGFVAKISGASDLLLTYQSFFGSDSDDFLYDVSVMGGTPVFCGLTQASGYSSQSCSVPTDGLFPSCASGFHQPLSSGADYFVARISSDGSDLLWSTAVGRAPTPISLATQRPSIATFSTGNTAQSLNQIVLSVRALKIYESTYQISPTSGFIMNTIAGEESGIYLARWRAVGSPQIHSLVWSSFFGSDNIEEPGALVFDSSNRFYLTGSTYTNSSQPFVDWCTPPNDGTFPLCNASSQNYMETQISNNLVISRTFIAAFDGNNNLLWSSYLGNGLSNVGRSLAVGNEKLFVGGRSDDSWTLYQFDPNSTEDYWQPNNAGFSDGVIARFDIPTIVQSSEIEYPSVPIVSVHPNPTRFGVSTIVAPLYANDVVTIEVYDSMGKRILQTTESSSNGKFQLATEHLSPGTYVIVISSLYSTSTCRLVKL